MKRQNWRWIRMLFIVGVVCRASDSFSGTGEQGFSPQGFSPQGFSLQGFSPQGFSPQGFSPQGFSPQGFSPQGFSPQGFSPQGFTLQGVAAQGIGAQGFSPQGFSPQGFSPQGLQLTGIDRLRGLAAPMQYQGLAYAGKSAPGTTLQGLQAVPSATPIVIDYTAPTALPRLQASPADATNAGSYIYVPGLSGTANDLKGTLWNLPFADATGTGAIGLFIADVSTDSSTNQSKYASNDDITLYTVYYRHPATNQWVSLCPVDGTGRAAAMAMPVDPSDWTSEASRTKFTFACTATGVGAKCARNWGYKPWKTVTEKVWSGTAFVDKAIPLKAFYDACLIAARADYCQDGQSYTKNGTLVDLFDTLDGFTSINATAGMPYAPGASGPMMHEEYQVSALDFASPDGKPHYALDAAELMSLPADERAALSTLRRSGMQSSRYSDLDPGRSCLAAPYLDRCDPHEPYACYRDANMSANAYGAFLAVNSPRHCDHDEATPGAPLDPLCNSCVTRVCSVDPSCCGDPGSTFFPGSLVWDGRCSAIRNQVCRSAPTMPVWSPGRVAPPAGSAAVVNRRGAVGSFEGIVTVSGARFAEGWACDPDYPGASSYLQISVGGVLGTPGATLTTLRADAPLVAGWRDTAAAECGAAGRHGFRFPLPDGSDGKDVYVYGIDLDTQAGAPFTLLRGGKKTVPSTAAAVSPRSAIWSGWLEPTTSGTHTFSVDAASGDRYRAWVNGVFVAGNWSDPDPTVPGAFTAPATQPALYLQKGVRYGVRIEYLRTPTNTASLLTLKWVPPGAAATAVAVPQSAFYPAAPGVGNGLLGTYFPGSFSAAPNATQTWGALDYVWTSCAAPATTCTRPAPGISVDDPFAARFEGQVMPPVSGSYLFTADSDASVSIWVNGNLVNDLSRRPPGAGDPSVCAHDICRTGAAISRTCDQGYFCSAQVCQRDPACCSVTWDAQCLQQVATVCHLDCRPSAPAPISLLAGVKYDIKVELQHPGGRGAKLQLFWALAGGARDKIPAQNLFAATNLAAPAKGVGLNAAYFSDPAVAFKTEYLDRVDSTVAFLGSSLPTVARAQTMVCGVAGVPACDAGGDVLGSPALVAPAAKASVPGPGVVVKVVGAAPGASVSIVDTLTGGTTPVTTTFGPFVATDGTLSQTLTLAKGEHSLAAKQALTGFATSALSAPLVVTVVDAVDATLPPPPVANAPAGGAVATNGKVTLSGTAAPGAKVNVTVAGTTTTFTANATTGAWTGSVTLPAPGLYTLSITQTSGGKTSTASSISARYALPPIVVTAPPAAETAFTGAVAVSGTATPGLGSVVVADGDGRIFADRVTLAVAANGAFSGSVTLDPGRHQLKFVQRHSSGLDSEAVLRTVLITPAASALRIDSPNEGEIVGNDVIVQGAGAPARTGLRYGVRVYQGATQVGQGTADDAGNFEIPVRLSGVGRQQLSVSLLVSSLSGAGAAESARSAARNVVILPPTPVMTRPAGSPFAQTSTTLTVAGTGIPNAQVSILVDRFPVVLSPALLVAANGTFSRNIVVAKGPHVVAVTQTLDGATSNVTPGVAVAIGDVTPPTLTVAKRDLVVSTASETGTTFAFFAAAGITATDAGVAVPVTCVPAATPAPFFPLGKTNVTCTAKDAAGNVATTTLTVTVTSTAGPLIAASDIIVEATGPEGAAVGYQVSATGFVADCAPPGSSEIIPCTSWRPVGTGLGFNPQTAAIDPQDGTLYATHGFIDESLPSKMFKSTDQGTTWTELPIAAPPWASSRITVARGVATGSPSTLYVPGAAGLLASTDGGQTSKVILPGVRVSGVSVDPNDPRHLFAWNLSYGGPVALFETTDGGQNWRYAADDLPIQSEPDLLQPHITDVVFDRLHPGRIYTLVSSNQPSFPPPPPRVHRRIGSGRWERLATPPIDPGGFYSGDAAIGVAPTLPPCTAAPCQTFPTVFVDGMMSLDGGDSWVAIDGLTAGLSAIVFDWQVAGRVYGMDGNFPVVSTDFGRLFTRITWDQSMQAAGMIQDTRQAQTLYVVRGQGGLLRSVDSGKTWSALNASAAGGLYTGPMDLAIDPVDAQTAYFLSFSGLFKSKDGGETWALRAAGVQPRGSFVVPHATQIAIDPFNNQTVYLSGNIDAGWPALVSVDAAGERGLPWAAMSVAGLLAPDAAARGLFFTAPNGTGEVSAAGLRNLIYRNLQGASADYALNVAGPMEVHGLQVLPDAARTIALTYHTSDTQGGTVLFSARDAQVAPATTGVRVALTGNPVKPLFDNSDGRESLFVSGDALGSTPDRLYKASLGDLQWGFLGGGQPGIDFRRLAIDQGSGGQLMYAVGSDDGVWQSKDGGRTWSEDVSAPSYVRRIWSSPLDGALYAAVLTFPSGAYELQNSVVSPLAFAAPATLWKRSLSALPPVGASVVEGDLRVKCGVSGGTRAVGSGSMFPVGKTTLTCTATDAFGNVGSRTFTIEVRDTRPPAITVPTSVTATTASTDPNVTVPVTYAVSATDAVGGPLTLTATAPTTPPNPAFFCTPASGSAFRLGVTAATCTARDAGGRQSTATFPVTVVRSGQPSAAPTLVVPANVTLEATDASGARANLTVTATRSTGAALTPTCTPALTSTFPLPSATASGTTTVSCSVTDAGFTVTRTFTVTVVDTRPPTITVPASPPTVPSQGAWGATVPFTVTATDLVNGAVTASCVPASGSVFAPGTTVVTCRASDKTGNSALARFNVVVQDLSPPVLTVPSLWVTQASDFLGGRVVYDVSATDAQDGTLPVDCAPLPGSWFPLGDTVVSCQAADTAGNTARATFTVRVVDSIPPELTVPATIIQEATQADGAPVAFAVKAFDAASGVVTPVCTRGGGLTAPVPVVTGAVFPLGDTLVTCSATDRALNAATASFHVIVRDTMGPVLKLPATRTVQTDASGTAVATFAVTATDRGVSVPVACTPPSGSRFLFGTTAVTCLARDAAGNETRGSFNVVVNDTVAPVFGRMPATVVAFAPSSAGAVATYTPPTATDAYEGVRPVACAPASGSTFPLGKTTVTCTSADSVGNTRTATFLVWVQYQTTQANGTTFLPPLAADGSTQVGPGGTLDFRFQLTGVSAPITSLTAVASVAPVATDGTVGTFVEANPGTGITGNTFTRIASGTDGVPGPRYLFTLRPTALTAGTYRFRADLGDGLMREINFIVTTKSLAWIPASFNFGNVAVGQQSPIVTFTLRNISGATVPLTKVAVLIIGESPGFSVLTDSCGDSLAPAAVCTIDVRFAPPSVGAKQSSYTISGGPGNMVSATFTGTGI